MKSKSFADKAIKYYTDISPPKKLPPGIEIINPYANESVKTVVRNFYTKFYSDNNERLYVIGINPGRFGGGLTGISFTDPVSLKEVCRIENDFGTRKELSSIFIYKVIERFGNVESFFSKVFLTALYPLTIIKDGKNYNYYDERNMFESLKDEIVKSVSTQIGFGARTDKAIILGRRNAKYFVPINKERNLFENIVLLDHPRYIMQYRLKNIDSYISKYMQAFF